MLRRERNWHLCRNRINFDSPCGLESTSPFFDLDVIGDNFIFFVCLIFEAHFQRSGAFLLSLSVNSRSAFSNVRLLHTLKFAS